MKRCSEVKWREDLPGFHESAAEADIGDLVWNPKMGEGHVLVRMGEPQQFGWEEPWSVPECECGQVDMLDHHTFLLGRSSSSGDEGA